MKAELSFKLRRKESHSPNIGLDKLYTLRGSEFELVPGDQTVLYHHWFDLNTGKRILKEGTGASKTRPGTAFFGGNTPEAFKAGLLPVLKLG